MSLVTGGGTAIPDPIGVGAAIAVVFAREGSRVAVLDRDATAAKATADMISSEGGLAIPVEADVSNEADCKRAVALTLESFDRLDIVVNSAAIVGPTTKDTDGVLNLPEEAWDHVMAVNAKGPMLMAKYAIPHIRQGGAIVNISSGSSQRADLSSVSYVASKGALNSLTLALAAQCAPKGIRVNAVVPAGLWAPMVLKSLLGLGLSEQEIVAERTRRVKGIPLGTEGTSWDAALAALFLASDESRWTTGHLLPVDGGFGVHRQR